MDKVKKRLKTLLRWGEAKRPEFSWPVPDLEPVQVRLCGHAPCTSRQNGQVVAETMELMRYHRDLLRQNWKALDVENLQARWYVGSHEL
jgi:hypothetical protein